MVDGLQHGCDLYDSTGVLEGVGGWGLGLQTSDLGLGLRISGLVNLVLGA